MSLSTEKLSLELETASLAETQMLLVPRTYSLTELCLNCRRYPVEVGRRFCCLLCQAEYEGCL
jgi:hypothetical protein